MKRKKKQYRCNTEHTTEITHVKGYKANSRVIDFILKK